MSNFQIKKGLVRLELTKQANYINLTWVVLKITIIIIKIYHQFVSCKWKYIFKIVFHNKKNNAVCYITIYNIYMMIEEDQIGQL